MYQHARQVMGVEIYSVLRGTMTIEVGGAEYELTRGDSILVTPWAVHEVKPRAPFLAQVLTLTSTGASDKHLTTA